MVFQTRWFGKPQMFDTHGWSKTVSGHAKASCGDVTDRSLREKFLAAVSEHVSFERRRRKAIRHAVSKTDGRRNITMADVARVSYDGRDADAWLTALPAFWATACLVAP